ncbi:MAG: hypothetical protein K2P25_00420 [Lachnospiraceae bacterium]|nr:hypothetical protein [Lachnospiraceae bacterium]
MRTALPSQAKLCDLAQRRRPVKSPRRMDKRCTAVVKKSNIMGERDVAPVHSPAEMLSMERASARRAASRQERTEGSSLLTLFVISLVVSPGFALLSF